MVDPIKYLFVDGGFLERICSQYARKMFGKTIDILDFIDFNRFVTGYDRVFYYDAYPAKTDKISDDDYEILKKKKEDFFNELNMTPNLRVHSGVSRRRKKASGGIEQKGVDVLLAIEAYQHAVQGNMDVAAILASDLDFYPLFDALVQTRVKTELICDVCSTSPDLIYAADRAFFISSEIIIRWLHDNWRDQCKLRLGIGWPFGERFNYSCYNVIGLFMKKKIVMGKVPGSPHLFFIYSEAKNSYVQSAIEFVVKDYFRDAKGRGIDLFKPADNT